LLLRVSSPHAIFIHGNYRRQHSSKDHDHGSHEEEEEGEEGSEEDLIRTFFRIRKRLDESPAALLLAIAVKRYSWRAMLLPSNT
jgi:hypothetical protein